MSVRGGPNEETGMGSRHIIVRHGLGLALSMAFVLTSTNASAQRVNKIVALLEAGEAVFGVFSGDKTPAQARAVVKQPLADFVFYSMERGPFDIEQMQVYMQFMMDRRSLIESENLFNEHPIILRIPPIRDGREDGIDRTIRGLDAGVHGIVFPHVESEQDAKDAVRAMRMLTAQGNPEGARPEDGGDAPRYWGLEHDDYVSAADLWPLNRRGELVSVLLIEDKVGIQNARDIVSVPGVSVVIPGPGDLSRAYEGDAAAIENAIQTVLAACKEFNVVCGITAGVADIEKRLDEGFRFFIVTEPEALEVGHRASGR